MGDWFDEKDSMKTVVNHIGGKHTPHSVKEDAKREYRERMRDAGLPDKVIDRQILDLED